MGFTMSSGRGHSGGSDAFRRRVLIGLLLLAAIQFGLLLGGDSAMRFGGVVAPLGFLAVLAFSLRFALVGTIRQRSTAPPPPRPPVSFRRR